MPVKQVKVNRGQMNNTMPENPQMMNNTMVENPQMMNNELLENQNVGLVNRFQQEDAEKLNLASMQTYNGKHKLARYNHTSRVILRNMETAYRKVNDIKGSADPYVEYHKSKGVELTEENKDLQGIDIVKISLAGSGFSEFRRSNKDIKKGKFIGELQVKDENGNTITVKYAEVGWKERLFGGIKAFFGGKKKKEERRKKMEEYRLYKKHKKEFEAKYKEIVGPELVKKDIVDNTITKKYEFAKGRRVVNGKTTKEKVSLAGPGKLDVGKTSISNTVSFVEEMYGDKVRNWVGKNKNNTDPKPFKFMLQGHSRGAVATGEAATRLQYIFNEELRKQGVSEDQRELLNSRFTIDLVLYDPVSGADNLRKVRNDIDFREQTPAMNKNKLAPLGENSKVTVFYSMSTEHTKLKFTPEAVRGADRVILIPYDHSATLSEISQVETKKNGETAGKKASMVKIDAQTGIAYKGMSINDMPAGFYIMDENNMMVKMKDADQAIKMHKAIRDAHKKVKEQSKRTKVIDSVATSYFHREEANPVNEIA